MNMVYEPSRSLPAKIARRVTPFLARRVLPVKLERPIISFTFDDCPRSAIENGVKTLEKSGWLSSLYVSGGLLNQINHHGMQISGADAKALYDAGHEIGGHSFSHQDAQSVGHDDFLADIERNQACLMELGLPPCRTFAYPYGQTHSALKKSLEAQFTGMRGIQPLVHRRAVDLNQIGSLPLFAGGGISKALQAINDLEKSPAWITFFTHDIRDNHSPWGCTPGDFQTIVKAVKKIDAQVLSVDQAITFLKDAS